MGSESPVPATAMLKRRRTDRSQLPMMRSYRNKSRIPDDFRVSEDGLKLPERGLTRLVPGLPVQLPESGNRLWTASKALSGAVLNTILARGALSR